MPSYKCFIRGENFPGSLISKDEPIGFYTTRFVQAASPAAAELAVVQALRADSDLQVPDGQPRPPDAKVFVDEIKRVVFRRRVTKGFCFFNYGEGAKQEAFKIEREANWGG